MNKEMTVAGEKIETDGTFFVAHWTHTPENFPGRSKEGAQMLIDLWAKPFMAQSTDRDVPCYIFHLQKHSEILLHWVEPECGCLRS